MAKSLIDRFEDKYIAEPNSGCWLWTASINGQGYGKINCELIPHLKRESHIASRVSWVLHKCPIPGGLFVCHHCDTPACVNPNHLFLGDHRDNALDMSRKGRSGAHVHPETLPRGDNHWSKSYPERYRRGDSHHTRLHPESLSRGEAHGQHVLSDVKVAEIRLRYSAGGILQRELADEYGVSRVTIGLIVNRKAWNHLP